MPAAFPESTRQANKYSRCHYPLTRCMEEAATVSSCPISIPPPQSALILTASFFKLSCYLLVAQAALPPSMKGTRACQSLPVSFMEKAVVLIFLLFLFFTHHSFGFISPVRLIILLMPFSALQFWLRHCQPSGKSAHHHHPLLMNFLGEAATVSVVFLHCPPPIFNYFHDVFFKLPGNGIASPCAVHKGEKRPPLPSPTHEFHREGSNSECCLFILIPHYC